MRAEEVTEPGKGMDGRTEGPRERTKPEAKRRHGSREYLRQS